MHEVVIGLDYGRKRIGVAGCWASLVEPLEIIENTGIPADPAVLQQVIAVFRREQATRIVVGLSEGEMAAETRIFAQALEQALLPQILPIEYFDETLSSQDADRRLRESGAPLKKRRSRTDHYAAATMLEEWVEAQEDAPDRE